MKVTCAWYECENYIKIPWWDWLLGVFVVRSFHPWLCPEHRDDHVFDDLEKELRRQGKLV
ncbi:hypothetical protein LCGC14_1395180 [marine sediment metagenome]|uniref:Uncharacterized protein n=1 Tax=marine sediment metagenome TaxID=412755 RepID=A0A0F9KJN1_9ZZZZ